MTKDIRPEVHLFNAPATPEFAEMIALVDKYRLLMGLTWHDFIVIGFANTIAEDNKEMASWLLTYVKNRRKPGRPKGQSVKAKLQRMGVDPSKVKSSYK